MKKKVFLITAILILLIVFLLYIFMVMDVTDLVHEVKDVFLWKYDSEYTKGKAIDRYNYNGCFGDTQFGNADLTLFPILVLHDYHDGYIYAFYSYKAYDIDGDLVTASLNVFTKWRVHKENGQWSIVEITEKP